MHFARDKKTLLIAGGVFALGAGIRLLYLLDTSDNPTFFVPIVDSEAYDWAGRALNGGEGLTEGFFWQPFFYPFFLSVVYRISGSSILFAKIVQAMLGGVTSLLTYRLGKKILGRGVGIVAGLIVATCGPLIFFDTELLAGGWACFWSVGLVLVLLKTAEKKSLPLFFLAGICGAVSVLTRPTFLPFFLAGCAWLGVKVWRSRKRRGLLARSALGVMAGFCLPVLPVAFANREVTGHFGFLPSSGGINFYIGNNPNYEQTVNARPGSQWSEIIDLPQRHGVWDRDMWARQEVYYRQVTQYVRSAPLSFAGGLARKALQFVNSREIPRNVDIYLFRKWSVILRALVWRAGPFGFPFGVMLPLAIVGLVLHLRKIPLVMLLGALLYSLSVILVFVTARYRTPMIPLISILSGAGAVGIVQITRRRRWGRLGLAAACACGTILLGTLPGPFIPEQMDYEPELYTALGEALSRTGRNDQAVGEFRRAIRLKPDFADAHASLAHALEKRNQTPEAIEHYRTGLTINPRIALAYDSLGTLLAAQKNYPEAIAQYRKGLEIRPHSVSMRTKLGKVLADQGKPDDAIREYKLALQYNPDYSLGHYRLGLAMVRKGQLSQAAHHFNQGILSRGEDDSHTNPGNLYFALGKVSLMLGNRPEALRHFAGAALQYSEQLRTDPDNPELHCNLGRVLYEQGRLPEAILHYRKGVAIDPDIVEARHTLAVALTRIGRPDEAVREYRGIIERHPDHVPSLSRLAWILATHPDGRIRDGAEAVRLTTHAAELTRHTDPFVLDVLAAAYAETARFDLALTTARKALDLAQDRNRPLLVGKIRLHVKLYRNRKPLRRPHPQGD